MIKTQWLTLPILIAFVILPRLSIDLYLPALPNMIDTLNTTDLSLKMTLTVFMFGYALSMLIAGSLADSIGRKQVMFYGLILFMLSSLVCALAPNVNVLIFGRFFQALGGCCGTVVSRVMVKDNYEREEQIKILAHLSSAMAICPLIIPVLGGSIQLYFGWRPVFFLLFALGFMLFIIGERQVQEVSQKMKPFSMTALMINYKMLLTNRLFIGYSLAIGLAWCDYFAFTLESPFIMQNILGLNSIAFGFVFSLVVLGYLVGTRIAKLYANTIGWNKLILIASFLTLCGAILLFMLTSFFPLHWQLIIFPMMIILAGVGIIIPCTQAAVMQPFPDIVGTASGLFFFIQMFMGTLSGLVLQSCAKDSVSPMSTIILVGSIILFLSFYKLIWQKRLSLLSLT